MHVPTTGVRSPRHGGRAVPPNPPQTPHMLPLAGAFPMHDRNAHTTAVAAHLQHCSTGPAPRRHHVSTTSAPRPAHVSTTPAHWLTAAVNVRLVTALGAVNTRVVPAIDCSDRDGIGYVSVSGKRTRARRRCHRCSLWAGSSSVTAVLHDCVLEPKGAAVGVGAWVHGVCAGCARHVCAFSQHGRVRSVTSSRCVIDVAQRGDVTAGRLHAMISAAGGVART